MNRLITTIILLCLPVVSYAEIYSCTGRKDASVIDVGLNGSWTSESGDYSEPVIVDTSRGLRPNSSWDDYIGQCERVSYTGFKCTEDTGSSLWVLWIGETSSGGVNFGLSHTGSWAITAYGGTCVKI